MSTSKTIDPGKCLINFAGFPVQHVSDGTFVKVTYDNDAFDLHMGEQGDGTWVRNRKNSATIEITLGAASPTNVHFLGLHLSDKMFGDGLKPFNMTDLFGNDAFVAEEARIIKVPDFEGSGSHTPRVWQIKTANLRAIPQVVAALLAV
jgi:hypothetical protein